jgi:hypothetical protein
MPVASGSQVRFPSHFRFSNRGIRRLPDQANDDLLAALTFVSG